MKVLIIPEDFVKDQYMLKPIIEKMVQQKYKKAQVQVCQNPRLRGISQALDRSMLTKIIETYPMIDLFLLCVDRDGDPNRETALRNLEGQAIEILTSSQRFLAEQAWQEIEVWVLAGHKAVLSDTGWTWQEIRDEPNPKEVYFLPFAKAKNVLDSPGEGRKILTKEAVKNYNRLCQLCPELADLAARIAQ